MNVFGLMEYNKMSGGWEIAKPIACIMGDHLDYAK
jgi:hypothetical protein